MPFSSVYFTIFSFKNIHSTQYYKTTLVHSLKRPHLCHSVLYILQYIHSRIYTALQNYTSPCYYWSHDAWQYLRYSCGILTRYASFKQKNKKTKNNNNNNNINDGFLTLRNYSTKVKKMMMQHNISLCKTRAA